MPRIINLANAKIAAIEAALSLKLPTEYVQFVTRYPFPELTYMRGEDLIELGELNAEKIILINENLRESALSPFKWQEKWFYLGERAGDEAIYYLDTALTDARVFLLEPGDEEGVHIADSFAVWADAQLQELVRMDIDCVRWHKRQKAFPWPFSLFFNHV